MYNSYINYKSKLHGGFDVSVLQQLGKGQAVGSEEEIYIEQTLTRYRVAVLILGIIAALFFLIIVLLLAL